MRVGIVQFNPHVGAIQRNAERILDFIAEAKRASCDLVIFPELAVCGYTPMDLIWRPGFLTDCQRAVDRIRDESRGIAVIVGSLTAEDAHDSYNRFDVSSSTDGAALCIFNSAHVLIDGRETCRSAKLHLPTFDVYDEKRHFSPGPGASVCRIGDVTVGVNICEDLWVDDGPIGVQASLGAEWIVNLSASPFYVGKPQIRRRLVSERAEDAAVGIIYANLVGGQDDVVFDGGSLVADARGRLCFEGPRFEETLAVVELDRLTPTHVEPDDSTMQVRKALTLGIRDYVQKNGFSSVLLGLSGGIDSALVAALAAEALGPDAVSAFYLPSRFSSDTSQQDAQETARLLGIPFAEISIDDAHRAFANALPEAPEGLVDENLQPRIRGTLLMALANQTGALVLCPGNKSEIAVGYSTLYGDTVGALAPISDLYKAEVVRLARSFDGLIPESVITKPPTAELRPDQRDDDDLPPYDQLDPLLHAILERNRSRTQLIADGFAEELVDRTLRRVYANEYKRRQLPPGLKVSPKAFGTGRRMPITNGYQD